LFHHSHEHGSFASENHGALEVVPGERAFRLGEERPGVFRHATFFRRQTGPFQAGKPVADLRLKVGDLLSLRRLLVGTFARFKRGNLQGWRRFRFRSRIDGLGADRAW
jgi:hypothetical protein